MNLYGTSGETLKSAITATGDSLRYQWYFKNDGSASRTKSGFTGNATAAMMIPVNATTVKRTFKRIVTDKYGVTAESDTFRVLISNIKILSQPKDIVSEEGFLESVTVVAQGTRLVYQW